MAKGKVKIYKKKITLKPHTWACVRSEEEKEKGSNPRTPKSIKLKGELKPS
ncbi:hypothetical protein HanHA300_Chr11g0395201 [Helianthus annuus]|nr:hypothetical protein HanHA300_Chr11g0395201 [Helianthus annuus]KAJ0508614.1 hypothetical protein HanIR_Chr11g0519191 [Helianthus annuus]KAJ0516845.1 hypothetical protein HanHA89_Chr11g0418381 [Helianthus annuus]KAJ0684850.1 hypothetical protein HanLR1_Chr11g0395811 [Helianthus annuus]KAJ0688777.1 hypothetical protein HanOQP8_Chr11g0398041 [Helianthus annuus]